MNHQEHEGRQERSAMPSARSVFKTYPYLSWSAKADHPRLSSFMTRYYYVYIVTNRPNGTLYIGVTNNLIRRVTEHREGRVEGFTKKYGLDRLVYYEIFENVSAAIAREKRLKTWLRAWKVRLIRGMNPEWNDLWDGLLDALPFS